MVVIADTLAIVFEALSLKSIDFHGSGQRCVKVFTITDRKSKNQSPYHISTKIPSCTASQCLGTKRIRYTHSR